MTVVRPLLAAVVCSAVAFAQTATPPPQEQSPAPQEQSPASHGKVLFSRSADDAQPAGAHPEKVQVETGKVSDVERSAVVFTAYDLDVHLMLQQQSLAVRAHVTVRNDGDRPLTYLPLQLSSSLQFESISKNGQKLPFAQQLINSDADHTGQLREAVVVLPAPLAPKTELMLDIVYSGGIPVSTKRLDQIGTPVDLAQQSDWDQISQDFTGLRGFGDVVWYPVSSIPQALGDGAKLFTEIGRQKLRQQSAQVAVRVTAEYIGAAPNAAVINGHFVPIPAPSVTPSASFPGVVTFSLPAQRLGFGTLNLFLATRIAHEANGIRVLAADFDEPNVQGYLTAATMVQPLIEPWLGSQPKEPLTIFDLPEKHDASFEQGAVTLTGLQALDPQVLGFVEIHIEQGPVLDTENIPLAVVSGIVGQTRLGLRFAGQANHAGTTPMNLRHDAMAAAAEWITMVETSVARAASANDPGLVATVGKVAVVPNATNVIPGTVEVSLDLRHMSNRTRSWWTSQLLKDAEIAAQKRGVGLESVRMVNEPAVEMDPDLPLNLRLAVEAAGYPLKTMPSGAGHDAMVMATRMPAAMLFLRSPGGISHHPSESVREEDVEAALHVGRKFLERLATESGS